MNKEKQLTLFDTIHRKSKTATSSTGEGKKGTYFFKNTGKKENNKAISRVWLNQKHFPELYRTHSNNEFMGKSVVFGCFT